MKHPRNRRSRSTSAESATPRKRTQCDTSSEALGDGNQNLPNDEVQEVPPPADTTDSQSQNKAKAKFESKYDTKTLSAEQILGASPRDFTIVDYF